MVRDWTERLHLRLSIRRILIPRSRQTSWPPRNARFGRRFGSRVLCRTPYGRGQPGVPPAGPSDKPSAEPANKPSSVPSAAPTAKPWATPTNGRSSGVPSAAPTSRPSATPANQAVRRSVCLRPRPRLPRRLRTGPSGGEPPATPSGKSDSWRNCGSRQVRPLTRLRRSHPGSRRTLARSRCRILSTK